MRKLILSVLSLAVVFMILVSCAAVAKLYPPTASKRRQYVAAHPELTDEVKAAILSGDVVIGMTMEEVIASRGRPWDVNRTTTAYGTDEQWVMGPVDSMATWPKKSKQYFYIYFENGKITAWQSW